MLYTRSLNEVVPLLLVLFLAAVSVPVYSMATESIGADSALSLQLVLVASLLLGASSLIWLAAIMRKELAVRSIIGKKAVIHLIDGIVVEGKVGHAEDFALLGQKVRVSTPEGVEEGKGYGKPPAFFLSVTKDDGKKMLINARMITKVERLE